MPFGDGHDVALSAELADLRRAVRAGMTALSPQQHQVIGLAYLGGLTQREVAHRLGQPLGTVKTRIRLGMLGDFQTVETYGAWLQGFALTGLALVLSGIVLALYTIAQVLRFQHRRVAEMAQGAE